MGAHRLPVVALLALSAPFAAVPLAHAVWQEQATADAGFSAAQLLAPTGLTATRKCLRDPKGVLVGASVDAAWTPGTAWATGQRAELRDAAGTLLDVADLGSAVTATTLDVPPGNVSATFTVTVVARYAGWSSPQAAASFGNCRGRPV